MNLFALLVPVVTVAATHFVHILSAVFLNIFKEVDLKQQLLPDMLTYFNFRWLGFLPKTFFIKTGFPSNLPQWKPFLSPFNGLLFH